ncbi:MAG: hypothetical protein F6K42_19230 [Leptolyngbya sp. SIO1D8]|nr:hypothetical protein [Leptolyngbya sp. SIO1D8]
MKPKKTWQILKLGALSLATFVLTGCPETQTSILPETDSTPAIPVAQAAIAPTSTINGLEPQAVSFEVCGNLPDWQRPDLETQTAELNQNPRYIDALSEEPLSSLFEKFWNESIITFTTYGLSARVEPIYLSGVWTGIEAMETCYEGDRPDAINQGQLAEIWLIGHRIINIDWSGDQYQILVEPTSQGLQFVQFDRVENNTALPILVLETDGAEMAVTSGDW